MKTESSSSYRSAEELRINADKMIAEANREIRKLFRASRKIQLTGRGGLILLVDDFPQQKSILTDMVKMYNLDLEIYNVFSAVDARAFINKNAKDIRLVVVDIMLIGSAAGPDGLLTEDGLSLVDWLKTEYPDLPFVITTGHAEKAEEAISRFPGADVLLKGETNIEEYADAIGLTMLMEEKDDMVGSSFGVIPVDI